MESLVTAGTQLPRVSLRDAVCVVTGASGFIGRRLCEALGKQGAIVVPWRRDGVAGASVDLLMPASLDAALLQTAPDFLFHLAAVGTRHQSAHDPAVISQSVSMTEAIFAAVGRRGVHPHIVIAGSMAEYGGSGRLQEDAVCLPTTSYAIGKLASSLYALAYGPLYEVSVTVARLFGVYGRGESADRLFPTVRSNVREGNVVPLSDGEQWRDFIHVDDVCVALMALATTRFAGIINVGTGNAVRVRDVVQWMSDELGAPASLLAFGTRPRSPGDADRLEADVTKLQRALGWVPAQRLAAAADFGALFDDEEGSEKS